MKKSLALVLSLFSLSAATAFAQPQMPWAMPAVPEVPEPVTVMIWPEGAPNAFECPYDSAMMKNNNLVYEAQMLVWPAANPNGKAVLACPGGGYAYLSRFHEGEHFAKWYNDQGITYAVLLYRMPAGHHDVPLSDVQQAMRILRADTALNIRQLGIMGSSAGGHLASTAATHYVDEATRPDFQILFYPVISMDPAITHQGSHDFLLGEDAAPELEALYSNEKHVTADTPAAFVMHCTDDDVVPIANSDRYFEALKANSLDTVSEYWVFPTGGHGWGFGDWYQYKPVWASHLSQWLKGL